jgi:hypothetical protein
VATPDATALQRSDLNQFLFADVGTEANGMTLSVVSVLARLGSDPWREADRLAELPKAEAADSLARMIAGMPRSLWDLPSAVAIAVRLTGLLPSRPVRSVGAVIGRRWPLPLPGKTTLVAVCVVLAAAFAALAFIQATPPAALDGSDVASFTAGQSGSGPAKGKSP